MPLAFLWLLLQLRPFRETKNQQKLPGHSDSLFLRHRVNHSPYNTNLSTCKHQHLSFFWTCDIRPWTKDAQEWTCFHKVQCSHNLLQVINFSFFCLLVVLIGFALTWMWTHCVQLQWFKQQQEVNTLGFSGIAPLLVIVQRPRERVLKACRFGRNKN